jgi:adenylylsulfate kinase-like enzyme
MRVLICGLSGSGKTTLAQALQHELTNAVHLNGDTLRGEARDTDFSVEGRLRQAVRMRQRCDQLHRENAGACVLLDFIAPLSACREIVAAHMIIFMDTISISKYPDTDAIFQKPNESLRIVTLRDFRYSTKSVANIIAQFRNLLP